MPLTVRKYNAQVRDQKTGNMIPAGLLSSDSLEAIDDAKEAAVTAVQTQQTTSVNAVTAAGMSAIAQFPSDTYPVCDSLASDFAPVYIANQAYNIGEYVMYQYNLYKCNTTILENQDSTFVTEHWTAVNAGKQLQQKINVYDKIDAYQLISTNGIEDQEPYNFRPSGGLNNVGDRKLVNKIVGGTVVWNQLINSDTEDWTTIQQSNYSFEYNIQLYKNHKYYIHEEGKIVDGNEGSFANVIVSFWKENSRGWWQDITAMRTNNSWSGIVAPILSEGENEEDYNIFRFQYISTNYYSPMQYRRFQVIDLTKMFGITIADYIYSLEQANAGDGVAWFKKLFPNDYYGYDAGSFQSVQISAHKTVGFNAYNNITGTARLLGGEQYQITGTYTSFTYTNDNGDIETIIPDENGYFIPNVNGILNVTEGDMTTTCIHLVKNGQRDNEWESYIEHFYPFDSSLMLLGVPYLDENNNLSYYGDEYTSNGKVKRKATMQTFNGSENWYQNTGISGTDADETRYFYARISEDLFVKDGAVISTEYQSKTIGGNGNEIGINVSARPNLGRSIVAIRPKNISTMTVNDFKAILTNNPLTIIFYNTIVRTEENVDSYTNSQIIDSYGTEEYIDAGVENGNRDVAIPVGHETFYPINLREKLEKAPSNPNEDGNYIVKQENGVNSYVSFTPFEVDNTLTQQGAAADAKTVGEEITTLKQQIANILAQLV